MNWIRANFALLTNYISQYTIRITFDTQVLRVEILAIDFRQEGPARGFFAAKSFDILHFIINLLQFS